MEQKMDGMQDMSVSTGNPKGTVKVHGFIPEPISSEMFQIEQLISFDFPEFLGFPVYDGHPRPNLDAVQ